MRWSDWQHEFPCTDNGEQMVRYYGITVMFPGERKKQSQDEWIPCILEPESSSRNIGRIGRG